MATEVSTGATSTETGPANRQKRDMGKGRGPKLTDLNIPIIKRKKTKRA
jgi:hypothetical protein